MPSIAWTAQQALHRKQRVKDRVHYVLLVSTPIQQSKSHVHRVWKENIERSLLLKRQLRAQLAQLDSRKLYKNKDRAPSAALANMRTDRNKSHVMHVILISLLKTSSLPRVSHVQMVLSPIQQVHQAVKAVKQASIGKP